MGPWCTDIQAPDWETRVAILSRKAEAMGIAIEPEILEFLAKNISRNVRRMEGALTRVAGYVGLTRKKADLETVQRLLRDILREENLKPDHHGNDPEEGGGLLPFADGRYAFPQTTREYCFSAAGSDVSIPHADRAFVAGDRWCIWGQGPRYRYSCVQNGGKYDGPGHFDQDVRSSCCTEQLSQSME